jgi:thiamine kinase-like enzyme
MMNQKKFTPLGQGKIASIVSDGEYAYKIYNPWIPIEHILKEERILKEVKKKTDLNVVDCEWLSDEKMLKMSLIDGKTLADLMRKEKYQFGIETLIQCQVSIYKFSDLNLEDAFTVFESIIKTSSLNDEIKQIALRSLSSINVQQQLCHFDIHLENIMISNETPIIIDWMNAKLGNPVMDIARTYIIMRQYVKRKANIYLKSICQKLNYQVEEVLKAIPLMAALRMLENDTTMFQEELNHLITNTTI